MRGVASREGRVSRNAEEIKELEKFQVASREGRVSRNAMEMLSELKEQSSRPARGV